MEVGAFPKRFQPRMANYEVESCPWSVEALVTDPELYQSSLWRHKDNPQFRISQKKIMEWETSNRESLSVAAYTDSFLWAVKSLLAGLRDKLESRRYCEDPSMSLEQIMDVKDDATEALQFLQSAARGVQDMMKMTVDRIGSQVLSRRDSWCNAMTSELPVAEKLKLRQEPMTGKMLFGTSAVARAKKSLKEEKDDLVQNKILESVAAVTGGKSARGRGYSAATKATPVEKRPEPATGQQDQVLSHSFRSQRGRGKGRGNLWEKQSTAPIHDYKKTAGRGQRGSFRGGRGRGNRA
jgi:hypothetical protein